MKKLIFAISCAFALSAYALPTYEPFTEYNALVAANPSNSIDLCTSGLLAPGGEPWLNWNFSGTTGTNIPGLDIQVTNWAASVFTSNSLVSFLPTNFPGFPSFGNSITTIVINPAQPFIAGAASANIVGNSAVLQFAQDFVRPAAGTKTLFVSYLFAVAQQGQTGSGNIGRYLDFVAATNIVEGTNTTGFYKTWQSLNNTFAVNTGPRYFGHGVFAPTATNFDLEPQDSGAGKTTLSNYTTDPVSFNTPYLVIGEFSFVSTNASAAGTKDTNTIWVNPPLAALGGLIPTNLVTNVDTVAITMSDVDGMVLLDRPGSGQSGGVGTNYMANLMLGSTWSYVTGGPEFTNGPIITNSGSTVTVSAAATAAGQSVSYQWQKITANGVVNVTNGVGGAGGGATISGVTTATLSLTGLTAGDFGSFQLLATASGTGYSLAQPVNLPLDPNITSQPQGSSVFPGNNAVLSVTASTLFGSLTYQWYLNGAPLANGTLADGSIISGVTNSTLTVSNFQADESGDVFTVAITNGLPTGVLSAGAVLTAYPDPSILVQSKSITTNFGATVSFSATAQTANAHVPITYAWYHGSTMLANGAQSDGSIAVNAQGTNAGATLTATLTLSNVSYLDNGSYSLFVTNSVGGVASSTPATLTVIDPFIIVQPPAVVEMALGGTNKIPVAGAGSGITYQWYNAASGPLSNGGDLSGVTTSNLDVSGAQLSDDGTYYVVLTGANGSIQSSNVTLIVDVPVTGVTVTPPSLTQQAGTHLALVGTVIGGAGGNLNQFWQFNGTNLTNGTQANKTVVSGVGTATLVLSNLQTAGSGTYTLIASNAAGGVTAASIIKVSAGLLPLSVTNLEVTRVGEGSEALSGATGNTLYLDQFTTNGAYVSTIMVPDNGASSLLVPGAGTDGQNEAYMTLSSNQAYLNFAGYFYNYPFSGADVTIGGNSGVRAIGAVNGLGYYVLAYTNFGLYSGGLHVIRDAYSTDGLTNFWTTGAAGSAAIKYVNAGPAGAAYSTGSGIPGLSTAVIGPRSLGLVGSNLVFSDNGDAIAGLDQFTGAPIINGATALNILSLGSPADFAFSPDSNTVYVADDSSSVAGGTGFGGGVQRWDLVGGSYTYAYNLEDTTGIGTGQTNGVRGLTVYFPTNITTWGQGVTKAVIYATTSETVSNRLIQFVDNGLNSPATLLATAGPNQFLRGVRFGPVTLPISIVTAPQGATVFSGNPDTLSILLGGDAPFFYQWQFNGTNIANATNSSITFANLQATNSGTYTVVVSNAISSNSASAVLAITASPPIVSVAPQSRVETIGDHLAFTVTANGTQPLHYQWQSNGVSITGATTSAYSLTNILQSYSATYSVVVTNAGGTNTNSAILTVTTNLQSLSSNNIVVSRIGDGVEALSSTTGDTLYLDQLTPAGVYSNTIMIPDNSAAGNLIISGGTSEGPQAAVLNLSANNFNNPLNNSNFLNFAGFATPYPATNALGGQVVPRAIGAVNAFGYYSRPITPITLYNTAADVFDSVVSLDGLTAFWTTGIAGSPPAVKYVTPATAGTGGGIASIAGTPQGTRVVNIVGFNLVYSDQQSSPAGIWAVNGLATGAGTPLNLIADAAGAPNDFAASPDTTGYPPTTSTVYVADSSTISSGGGIQRYDWNGVAYALTYTLGTGTGSTAGASGLTVNFGANSTWGSNVLGAVIFATTTGNPGNSLIKIVDTGSNSTATVLETANPNQILRGVRFGPVQGPPIFTAQPIPTNAFVGGVAVFSAVAQNGPIIGYQWQLNGVNLTNGPSGSGSGAIISGATNSTLVISNVGPLDEQGNYTLVATNPYGSATSQSASLVVPVKIVTYPAAFQNITNGGTATFTVVATGGPVLTYQWNGPCGGLSDGVDPCNPAGIISGSSTATLTIANVSSADTGSYTVSVNNPDSSTNNQAQPAVLNVYSGPPKVYTDIQPASLVVPVGYNASFTATIVGNTPLAYQWQVNGSNLTDNGHVSGSQTPTLVIPNAQLSDSGNYQLTITNGAGSNHTSSASLTVTLIGFNNGGGWAGKGTGSITNGTLSLTLASTNQITSAFLVDPVDVLGFLATWTYQDIGGGGADGAAFVLQNSSLGANASGAGGGDLGYVGISNSIAFEFNIYSNNTVGLAIGTNGFGKSGTTTNGGGPYVSASPVNIASGDPIAVSLQYLNGLATLTLTDAVTSVTYTTNFHVNIPAFVGSNTAYVGFTGASGGVASSQTISNFFFTSLPAVSIQQGATGSLTFTWPVAAAGFQLQQVSDLTITNWVNVTNPPTVTNGQNQITITPVSTNEFYRLMIQ